MFCIIINHLAQSSAMRCLHSETQDILKYNDSLLAVTQYHHSPDHQIQLDLFPRHSISWKTAELLCVIWMHQVHFNTIAVHVLNVLLGCWYPSFLHTTSPSRLSKRSSLTVPHNPLLQYSTLPSSVLGPSGPTRRMLPSVQDTKGYKCILNHVLLGTEMQEQLDTVADKWHKHPKM